MLSHTLLTARFFDGIKFQPFVAKIEITSSEVHIRILDNGEEKTLTWEAHTLQVIERPHDKRNAVIGCTKMIGARLILTNEEQYLAILPLVPKRNIKASQVNHSWRNLLLLMLGCLGILIGAIIGIPYAAPLIAKNIPASWDDYLGKKVITVISTPHLECVAPEGKKALTKLTTRLTHGFMPAIEFDVKVIDYGKGNINAFAVPGFHIVIMGDLLRFANDPDEVAAILSHEMGHAILHHPTQTLIRRLGIQLIVTSMVGNSPIDVATQFLHLKHTRDDEQLADDKGVEILTQANIDKKGFVTFFEKLMANKSEPLLNQDIMIYFSDHPAVEERIKKIKSQPALEKPTPSLTKQEWQDLKNICSQKEAIK